MGRINGILRKRINRSNIRRLKNRDFSLISSNCNGGFILHNLGMKFNSPTVNLWIRPDDFIKFLQHIRYYLECDMTFAEEPDISYPIGVLDDIKIYFLHYATQAEAKDKWTERAKRINFNDLFILFTDRNGCTYENLRDFEALPYKNKVVFTHLPYPEFQTACYLKGWEKEESVDMCFRFKNRFSGKKILRCL